MFNTTDIWQWVHNDIPRLEAEGGARQELVNNYHAFWQCYEDDPVGAELAIHRAIELAKASGEIRWELHLRHWRIQHWLRQDQIKRMLPEAIDLLDLAVDERVKDVPQRICAYHDVVECYVEIDPAGYYEAIKENALHILAQLPQTFPCADCARSHLARAAAAAGQRAEAEHWLAEYAANFSSDLTASNKNARGNTYLYLQDWDRAEQEFKDAATLAQQGQESIAYLWALLGIAQAKIGKKDLAGLDQMLPHIRQRAKYDTLPGLLARLLEVEGHRAEQHNVPQAALSYFTRAATLFNELGCARDAATLSLHALELIKQQELAASEELLAIARTAVGSLPPASQDLYQRLAALGYQPLEAAQAISQNEGQLDAERLKEREERQDLASIEAVLHAHLQSGNTQGITTTLFRLGTWHHNHKQFRAAVDYFIWGAALERLHHYPRAEREDSLKALEFMSKKLPADAIASALRAAASAPPAQFLPTLRHLSNEQWQWTLQAIATELAGKPVVEPEPEDTNSQRSMIEALETAAEISTLITRFHQQADPEKCEEWAQALEQQAQGIVARAGEQGETTDVQALLLFLRSLAQLARGSSFDEILQQELLPPFDRVLKQMAQCVQQPIWQHPGNHPLDLFIERTAQRTVRVLRRHHKDRARLLANHIFLNTLLAIDLRQHEQLQQIAHFLDAINLLLKNDGQQLPQLAQPLARPYDAILAAIYEEGSKDEPAEQSDQSQAQTDELEEN